MSQMIQAYFKTENDAEKVRIQLQKLDTESIEIGELEDPIQSSELFAPFAILPTSGTTGTGGGGLTNESAGVGGNAFGPYIGFQELGRSIDDHDDPGEAPESLDECRMVLSVRVEDEDYREAMHIIAQNEGLVYKDRS